MLANMSPQVKRTCCPRSGSIHRRQLLPPLLHASCHPATTVSAAAISTATSVFAATGGGGIAPCVGSLHDLHPDGRVLGTARRQNAVAFALLVLCVSQACLGK
jgi:hypothetical protein